MRELRIGLVLYGGVSLAVYINGVVTEIWQALRASRQRHGSAPGPALSGSAAVYADLLQEIADRHGVALRVVVDAAAGSSAGGVNGVALARAVTAGGDATILNRVWLDEADIAALRAEPPARAPFLLRSALWALRHLLPGLARLHRQVEGLPGLSWAWLRDSLYSALTVPDGRATPLDGGHFARMIATTLKRIGGSGGPVLLPDRGTFDLFVTATDLHGWPRHLPLHRPLHRGEIHERTHALVMAFRHRPGERIDRDFDLTFAARATASFPAAFAPTSFADIAAAWRPARPGEPPPDPAAFALRHLPEHVCAGFPPENCWLVDGGVLDNKPFSQVAAAIEDKPADHEVYRMLLYVEPDPEGRIDPPGAGVPRPLEVMQGLYRLFRHEPAHLDLKALEARNAKVEALQALRTAAEAETVTTARAIAGRGGLAWPPEAGELAAWQRETSRLAGSGEMPGYAGYTVLKARQAGAILSGLACAVLNHPDHSRQGWFLRALVRAWLELKGALQPPLFDPGTGFRMTVPQRDLLQAFDLPYRQRRLRALVQAVNRGYDTTGDEAAGRRESVDAAKRAFSDIAFACEAVRREMAALAAPFLDSLRLPAGALDDEIGALKDDPLAVAARYAPRLDPLFEALSAHGRAAYRTLARQRAAAIAELPEALRRQVAWTEASFPLVDILLFPPMAMAGIGDLIQVRAMRVSPGDAELLAADRPPLQGRELGAFAGFLRRSAREHDLLWGRLDGAERLVRLIVAAAGADRPGPELQALQADATRRAMLAILDEEEARPGCSIGAQIRGIRGRLERMARQAEMPVA